MHEVSLRAGFDRLTIQLDRDAQVQWDVAFTAEATVEVGSFRGRSASTLVGVDVLVAFKRAVDDLADSRDDRAELSVAEAFTVVLQLDGQGHVQVAGVTKRQGCALSYSFNVDQTDLVELSATLAGVIEEHVARRE